MTRSSKLIQLLGRWKIVSNDPKKIVFELSSDYGNKAMSVHEAKRITIEPQKRLFLGESAMPDPAGSMPARSPRLPNGRRIFQISQPR